MSTESILILDAARRDGNHKPIHALWKRQAETDKSHDALTGGVQ